MSPHGPTYSRTALPEPVKAKSMTTHALLRSVSDWTDLCQRCASAEPLPDLEYAGLTLGLHDPDIIPFHARCAAKQLSRT